MRKEKWEELKHYIDEFQTIHVQPVTSSPSFLSISTCLYTLNNKKVILRERLEKNHQDGNAVIVFPITENGECILTVEPRVYTNLTVGVGFPAGYINEGEDYSNAAVRELLEETGYQPTNLQYLAKFYQDEGCSAACNYGFVATGCKKVANQKLDEGEFIHYFTCDLDEVEELISQGYILGASSQLVYEKVKTYLKK